ncbi:serine/threonine-protein kinase [Chryseobacterium sp. SL1]|uniref:serine/threonine-protein kinase n=1 Tax=Chryseobacterium sp. SL1 TaxID=2995159 RepID=UPI002273101A|nr:serine/threonine-protein kinase [Chryseobacterium sp. SL1]MCY1660127.1 serine/threonine-protein kinase [Chryseobacterium sp. SL1]
MPKKININNEDHQINDSDLILSGGEGSVYLLKDPQCVKILFDQHLQDSMKINKVLALCDKSDYLSGLSGFEDVAIPLFPAYHEENFCGFSMPFFKDSIPINSILYDHFEQKYNIEEITDGDIVNIIQQLFRLLQILHKQRIIVGDLNSDNILINPDSKKTYLVDVDSAQVGEFYCGFSKEEYCCPIVESMGRNSSGGYSFSTSSDIYSLTIICFELITGIHPFQPGVEPAIDVLEAKSKGINYVSYHYKNIKKDKGFQLIDKESYTLIFKRLDHIKKAYPSLYQHFVDVFDLNKRRYFERSTITNVVQKKQKRSIRPIRGYTPAKSRQDPEEFSLFVKQYNLI